MKDLKIEISIPKEAIEEVLITAMEGGSNYWYALNGDENRCSTWLDRQSIFQITFQSTIMVTGIAQMLYFN